MSYITTKENGILIFNINEMIDFDEWNHPETGVVAQMKKEFMSNDSMFCMCVFDENFKGWDIIPEKYNSGLYNDINDKKCHFAFVGADKHVELMCFFLNCFTPSHVDIKYFADVRSADYWLREWRSAKAA